ncbi:MAG: transposase [Parcubacteria group bacterium]|nr:transposase [Parcubacteria group bacterium]MCR4342839.1 transposase [Patescibacteria group bacterium]
MRKIQISVGEYYHLYNRGNDKQLIFLDSADKARFLFLILYFQSNITFDKPGRQVSYFIKNKTFNLSQKITKQIQDERMVELINFTFMPNHFHLTMREVKEGGISYYMQRVLNSYTKYFNAKYKKSGHLFQGPYQVVHVEDNEQLLHLSAYIHRNAREIKKYKNKEDQYPWSSFHDYINENRWGGLLETTIIFNQFSNHKQYKDFVDTSGTKL